MLAGIFNFLFLLLFRFLSLLKTEDVNVFINRDIDVYYILGDFINAYTHIHIHREIRQKTLLPSHASFNYYSMYLPTFRTNT